MSCIFTPIATMSYRDLLNIEDLKKSDADEVVEKLSKLGLSLEE